MGSLLCTCKAGNLPHLQIPSVQNLYKGDTLYAQRTPREAVQKRICLDIKPYTNKQRQFPSNGTQNNSYTIWYHRSVVTHLQHLQFYCFHIVILLFYSHSQNWPWAFRGRCNWACTFDLKALSKLDEYGWTSDERWKDAKHVDDLL